MSCIRPIGQDSGAISESKRPIYKQGCGRESWHPLLFIEGRGLPLALALALFLGDTNVR